jgi:hypothetical protein
MSEGWGLETQPLVIDVPGCVKARDYEIGSPGHFDTDPSGSYTLCDYSQPVFYPADYYKGVKIIRKQEPLPPTQNEARPAQPTAGTGGNLNRGEGPPPPVIPCPPNDPPYPVGAVGKYGTAKVTGFKRDEVTGECITLWEKLPVMSVIDSYSPPPTLVVSTFTVALFGASAALFASPLTKLITKTLKPISKQVIARVKAKLGKSEKPISRSERMKIQREKRAVDLMWRSLKKKK